jgi:hypothetical protein
MRFIIVGENKVVEICDQCLYHPGNAIVSCCSYRPEYKDACIQYVAMRKSQSKASIFRRAYNKEEGDYRETLSELGRRGGLKTAAKKRRDKKFKEETYWWEKI